MIRKLGSAGLALSVLWAIISLVVKGGVGVSRAQVVTTSDFSITGAKAEITHETANQCLNESISCSSPSSDSDSYEILAKLVLNPTGDFQRDLNQTIFISLAPGNCSNPGLNTTLFSSWIGVIPGASLKKRTDEDFTKYTFEGNIPRERNILFFDGTFPLFDRAEFHLKIPTDDGSPTLALEGNANLCPINGPMALGISFRETPRDLDSDFACVNIPAPKFETLDISSAVCPIF